MNGKDERGYRKPYDWEIKRWNGHYHPPSVMCLTFCPKFTGSLKTSIDDLLNAIESESKGQTK